MKAEKNRLQSLSRALDVLELVESADQPVSLTDIAKALDEATPIVFRALETLEARGYVHRRPNDKRYLRLAPSSGHSAIRRSIALMRALASTDNRGSGTPWLATQTGLEPQLVDELLATLVEENMVEALPNGTEWRLAYSLLELSRPLLNGNELARIVGPAMQRLHADTSETVSLFNLAGHHQVLSAVLPSPHPLRYVLDIGSSFPLHLGAAGKAALAGMESPEVEALLARDDLVRLTDYVPDRDRLRDELAATRQRGYALSFGERVEGATAVAAGVRDASGRMRAVLSLMMPSSRAPADKAHALGERLVREVDAIYIPPLAFE
ncbi:IclR family transcriptional regulator [Halomonas sp. HMF6819]|uniref:IclR family transcriptional regulator n=1 Tax=unclassified Halomonas TaxID=2609666 RepID=UPI002076A3FF|nr:MULTISPECIES: IclR family transcriptional regulator C-terminal domain-containing protein [unclassified Halomonas]